MPLQKRLDVLTIIREACKQLSLQPPLGIFDSLDENAVLMGSVITNAGIMINDAHDWQSQRLPVLFTGDGTRTSYALPDDFARFVDGTGWTGANQSPVCPVSPVQWRAAEAWSGDFYIHPVCRIMRDELQFLSPLADGATVSFEYISDLWVLDGEDLTNMKRRVTHNADLPVWDWLLMLHAVKAKWLEAKQMDNVGVMSDFRDRLLQLTQKDVLAPVLSLNGGAVGAGIRYLDGFNLPQTGFGS